MIDQAEHGKSRTSRRAGNGTKLALKSKEDQQGSVMQGRDEAASQHHLTFLII
jgi:hypothetical protein